ncbi:uncharacterized protein B0H64DRAFT_403994 [Chaetomium fimeti]|uniref:Uncharacterized protein n=1 Tax=Chaetomium fimeti TaxID=1854472 RepID=A0AAE0HB62_9PEZI|nr:hypothetical protein B0H64DRAFT_403994 [Chaetomium fimeti]
MRCVSGNLKVDSFDDSSFACSCLFIHIVCLAFFLRFFLFCFVVFGCVFFADGGDAAAHHTCSPFQHLASGICTFRAGCNESCCRDDRSKCGEGGSEPCRFGVLGQGPCQGGPEHLKPCGAHISVSRSQHQDQFGQAQTSRSWRFLKRAAPCGQAVLRFRLVIFVIDGSIARTSMSASREELRAQLMMTTRCDNRARQTRSQTLGHRPHQNHRRRWRENVQDPFSFSTAIAV